MSNKAEATWHPNAAPEVPHADLIARLRRWFDWEWVNPEARQAAAEAADALAALGDTVPADQANILTLALMRAERARDEARAERDALAHVIERGRALRMESGEHLSPWAKDALDKLLAESDSAKAMALHDAEVWDEGFEEGAGVGHTGEHNKDGLNPYRAAAIREETK